MHASSAFDRSSTSALPVTRAQGRSAAPSLPWPFAAALIAGASAGLWMLLFRVVRTLLG